MHRPLRAIENSVALTASQPAARTANKTMTEPHTDEIVHRELDTERADPAVAIAEVIAELEGTQPDELTTTHDCIDGMISELFSNPPSPEAQMVVEFTYSGYRITIEQSGAAEFLHVT